MSAGKPVEGVLEREMLIWLLLRNMRSIWNWNK